MVESSTERLTRLRDALKESAVRVSTSTTSLASSTILRREKPAPDIFPLPLVQEELPAAQPGPAQDARARQAAEELGKTISSKRAVIKTDYAVLVSLLDELETLVKSLGAEFISVFSSIAGKRGIARLAIAGVNVPAATIESLDEAHREITSLYSWAVSEKRNIESAVIIEARRAEAGRLVQEAAERAAEEQRAAVRQAELQRAEEAAQAQEAAKKEARAKQVAEQQRLRHEAAEQRKAARIKIMEKRTRQKEMKKRAVPVIKEQERITAELAEQQLNTRKAEAARRAEARRQEEAKRAEAVRQEQEAAEEQRMVLVREAQQRIFLLEQCASMDLSCSSDEVRAAISELEHSNASKELSTVEESLTIKGEVELAQLAREAYERIQLRTPFEQAYAQNRSALAEIFFLAGCSESHCNDIISFLREHNDDAILRVILERCESDPTFGKYVATVNISLLLIDTGQKEKQDARPEKQAAAPRAQISDDPIYLEALGYLGQPGMLNEFNARQNARKLEKQGKYLEAIDIYDRLGEPSDLEEAQRIRNALAQRAVAVPAEPTVPAAPKDAVTSVEVDLTEDAVEVPAPSDSAMQPATEFASEDAAEFVNEGSAALVQRFNESGTSSNDRIKILKVLAARSEEQNKFEQCLAIVMERIGDDLVAGDKAIDTQQGIAMLARKDLQVLLESYPDTTEQHLVRLFAFLLDKGANTAIEDVLKLGDTDDT